MKRILIIMFSFACVVTLLYLGTNMYENKSHQIFKEKKIEEIRQIEP